MSIQDSLNKIGRNAGIVSGGIVISRVFGLVRDILIAFFVTDRFTDIFFLVFTIPNFSRRFFGEGALSSAFIPLFSQEYKKSGSKEAWKMASSIVNLTFLLLILLTALGILLAPSIINIIAPGFDQYAQHQAISNLRIVFPFMVFICLQAIFMGMLNSVGHFFIPSFAPVLFNLSLIALMLLFHTELGQSIIPLSLGVVIGGFFQMAVQIPPLIQKGYRHYLHIQWRTPLVRRMFQLMGPAVLGAGTVQINIMVNKIFASFLPAGAISSLYYSSRLIELPIALFGASLVTAAFPLLSHHAIDGNRNAMKKTILSSLGLLGFATIPSICILIVLGRPAINLLFERGEFTVYSTEATYFALICYSVGLFAFSGTKILVSSFYSLKDMATPMKIGLITVVANIFLNVFLIRPMAHGGLALATSLVAFLNFTLLLYYLKYPLGKLNVAMLIPSFLKILASSLLMSLVLLVGAHFLYSPYWNIIKKAGGFLLILSLGITTYLLFCHLLKVQELKYVKGILRWKSKNK